MKAQKHAGAAPAIKAHLLIVEARFYGAITDELARGAVAVIESAGASYERVAVPGALEVPGTIAIAAAARRFDGFVALGCVLRGETSHYEIVANESARGLMDLSLRGLAIGNGILTCESEAQAWVRARVGEMDKGGAAADSALAMIEVTRSMKKTRK
jgi:6,7-dimethyl-8-ribityllumazine synthase